MKQKTQNGNHPISSVDELLPIDLVTNNQECAETQEDEPEEDPALVQTKHDFATSPWTRLIIIGSVFGLAFLVVFVVLHGMMNSNSSKKKSAIAPTPNPTTNVETKDGDVYAKLALARQQQELDALNGKKDKSPEPTPQNNTSTKNENTSPKVAIQQPKTQPVTETPQQQPRRRVYQVSAAEPTPIPRRRQVASQTASEPIPALRPTAPTRSRTQAALAKLSAPQTQQTSYATDPMAEIEHLRSYGSAGQIQYMSSISTQIPTRSELVEASVRTPIKTETETISSTNKTRTISTPTKIPTTTQPVTQQIEQLRPRWEPTNVQKISLSTSTINEEAQILEEKPQPPQQYLVTGSFASAVLTTPLISLQNNQNNNNKVKPNNSQFQARLTSPLYSNTGEIAIPEGTLVAIAPVGVEDGTFRAEVTSILKDQTEYPVAPGTISIWQSQGMPLVAKAMHNKGGELAKYDTTLGALAGLAKVGEIINKPTQQTTQVLPLGGTITNSSGGNHNIGAAFIEGAFGSLNTTVGKRTEKATSEIMSRPNVWYVPNNTRILLRVNQPIKL